MAIITIDKASIAFGHHLLLDKVSFGIEKNEKIGLIGRNGSGKSSLLKAIYGVLPLDDGRVYIADGIKIVYIAQEPELNSKNTIFEEVFSGLGEIKNHISEYYKTLNLLESDQTETTLDRLNTLQEQLDYHNGWAVKNLIDKTLSELKLRGFKKIGSLSGGIKKKVAIAKALVVNPDVLLLDEPTNHLDIYTVEWLENIINNFAGTVLLITHDRTFLDKTVNKIIELDRGKLNSYPGNFTVYQTTKMQQLQDEVKNNQEFDKFLAQEEIWIRKGIEARRTRNEGRVRRLEQLRNTRSQRRDKVGNVNFRIDSSNASGKIVADLENINVSFENRIIIKNLTTTIMRGDKIGLIGPNGVGKSTLLKVILGQLKPNSGKIKLGTKIDIAYFDQFREQLDENATIQEVVSQGQDFVEINGHKMHISTYLEQFLFAPNRFRSQVKSLSGGERNRLLLARLFSRPANVLVLDEPTNDLDIETLELLEELLANYSGTIFLVSHDRSFLDNVVTTSYIFLGNGQILEFYGGYSDWLEYNSKHNLSKNNTNKTKIEFLNENVEKPKRISNKLSYKEKLELEQLPKNIQRLENELSELQNNLLNVDIYKKEPHKAHHYQLRINKIEEELIEKITRWDLLEKK